MQDLAAYDLDPKMELHTRDIPKYGLWLLTFSIVLALVLNYTTCKITQIPGPWYSKFSGLILKWYTITGRRLHYIHKLHGKYGKVVRISPTEVCVVDQKAYQEIHKIGSGFWKAPWYRTFRKSDDVGSTDMFSSLDPRVHGSKRKVLARPFSMTSLREHWEDMVIDKVATTVSRITAESKGAGKVDIFKWMTFMTTDIIIKVAFGEDFRMAETGVKTKFVLDLETSAKYSGIKAEFSWFFNAVQRLSFGCIDLLSGPRKRIHKVAADVMTRMSERKLGRGNVFFGVQAAMEDPEQQKSPHSIAYASYEGQSMIVAGSGTTAVTLTYLMWAVLKQHHIQERLEEEVGGLVDGFRDQDLERLPYLNAVLHETLRLYGAAPGPLPRTNYRAPLHVGDAVIPAGVTVSTQAWTMHRNPEVFSEPERFNPDRWLNATPEMVAACRPFGSGARICIGLNLAYMEMRHTMARFFRECKGARLASPDVDADMLVQHYFLISPKGGKCELMI